MEWMEHIAGVPGRPGLINSVDQSHRSRRMINQRGGTPAHLSGLPYSSPTRGKQSTDIFLQRQGRRRFAKVVDTAVSDLERPRVNVKALGRSATMPRSVTRARQRTR